MATYLALHQIKAHMSPEEAAQLVYATIRSLTKDTEWLRYWISDDDGKMVCLWSAPDAASVWSVLRSAGVPTSDVFEVVEGDPALLSMGSGK